MLVAIEGEWTVGFVAAGPADVPADSPLGSARPGARSARCSSSRGGDGAGTAGGCSPPRRRRCGSAAPATAWPGCRRRTTRRAGSTPGAGWEPDGTVRGLDTGDGVLREVRYTGSLDLHLDG